MSGADDDRAASLRLLFATYRARPASTQLVERPRHQHVQVQVDTAVLQQHLQVHRAGITGAVVRERGGTPFRQIFWGRGTALRQISLATAGGTLTPKSSGKSRRTRWVDPRSVYFLALIAPKRGIWHQKSPKKIYEGDTPGPPQREGRPPPAPTPARLHAVRGGASSPVAGT